MSTETRYVNENGEFMGYCNSCGEETELYCTARTAARTATTATRNEEHRMIICPIPEDTVSHKFVISPATKKLMNGLFEALSDELQEHRDAWDERSEKWQDSDAGTNAEAWMEQFDHLLDELDNVADAPES